MSSLVLIQYKILLTSYSVLSYNMELHYFIWYNNIRHILLRVGFQPKNLLLDQILISFAMLVAIQNLFYFPFFFFIYNDWVQ